MSAISLLSDLQERVNNIPDSAPGDAEIVRAALIRDGDTDLLPYLFGGAA